MFQGTLNSWFKIQLYTYVPFMLQDLYSMLTLCEKTRFQWALNDCPWGVSMKSKLELCCEAPSPTNDARPSLHKKCCEAPSTTNVARPPADLMSSWTPLMADEAISWISSWRFCSSLDYNKTIYTLSSKQLQHMYTGTVLYCMILSIQNFTI